MIASLLLIGALINVAWGIATPPYLSGLRPHSDDSLSSIVLEEQETLRLRYGFFAHLHDLAAGSTVIIPEEGVVDRLLAETLSHVDLVVDGSYDAETTEDALRSLPFIVRQVGWGAVAEDGPNVRYRLLVSEGEPATMVYFRVGPVVYLVDDRLGRP